MGAAVAAGVWVAAWGNWGPAGLMRTVLPMAASWRHAGGHPYSWIDRVFTDPALTGDTFLIFAGFVPRTVPDHEDVVQRVYFRGVYDRYPQARLVVTAEPVAINRGRDIPVGSDPPPPAQLGGLGIRQVAVCRNPESGPITVQLFQLRSE
jgi:hypothetical protein